MTVDALREFLAENPDAIVTPWGSVAKPQLTRPHRTTKEYGVLLFWSVAEHPMELEAIWQELCPVTNGKSAPRSSYMHAPAVRAFEPGVPPLGTVECWFKNTKKPLVFNDSMNVVDPKQAKPGEPARVIFTVQAIRRRPVPVLLGVQLLGAQP